MKIGAKLIAGDITIALCVGLVALTANQSVKGLEREFLVYKEQMVPIVESLHELKIYTLSIISSANEVALNEILALKAKNNMGSMQKLKD